MKICELVDCVFVDVGNAADMIWIVFVNKKGVEINLHLQCRFRICKLGEIIFTNMDVYSDNFDEYKVKIANVLMESKITYISNNKFNDLVIEFNDGFKIETFNVYNSHNKGKELWRIFAKQEDKHLVARSNGLFEE